MKKKLNFSNGSTIEFGYVKDKYIGSFIANDGSIVKIDRLGNTSTLKSTIPLMRRGKMKNIKAV